VQHGAEEFTALPRLSIFSFFLEEIAGRMDLRTPEGKMLAARECFPRVRALESEIYRSECLREFAERTGVPVDAVVRDYARRAGGEEGRGAAERGEEAAAPRRTPALHLAVLVAAHPELLSDAELGIVADLFQDGSSRRLYEVVAASGAKSLGDVMEAATEPRMREYLARETASGRYDERFREQAGECVRDIRLAAERGGLRSLREALAEAEKKGDGLAVDEVLGRIRETKLRIEEIAAGNGQGQGNGRDR
jgi:DNA primase